MKIIHAPRMQVSHVSLKLQYFMNYNATYAKQCMVIICRWSNLISHLRLQDLHNSLKCLTQAITQRHSHILVP